MPHFALNHMTVARLSYAGLLEAAAALGCVGVEVRNDLPGPLFDGLEPARAGEMAREKGLRLLALAEVKRFNDWTPEREAEARALMAIAREAGAEAVSLIPRNDGSCMGTARTDLRRALAALVPLLEEHGLVGLVEPLGFRACPLRDKADSVAVVEELGAGDRVRIIHDTFHHHLAGGGPLFPAETAIVHVSGVVDPVPSADEMTDAHRVLVDGADRLGNLAQLRALRDVGWDGPVSFEAFAPETHALTDPITSLRRSMDHIRAGLERAAA